MSLLVLAVLLSTVWAAILDRTQNPEYPPNLISYVLRVQKLHCPKSNSTVVLTLGAINEHLRNNFLKALTGKIVIGSEGLLLQQTIPKVDCGIIFVNLQTVSISNSFFIVKIINPSTDCVPRKHVD